MITVPFSHLKLIDTQMETVRWLLSAKDGRNAV